MADGLFYVDTRGPHLSADVPAVTLGPAYKALIPVANMPVLGSNYFGFVGKAVRLTMFGRMITGATPGSLTFGLLWSATGADNVGTVIVQSGGIVLSASQSNLTWRAEFIVRCRAMGVSGALFGTGMFNTHSALAPTVNMIPASAPAQVTLDLTAANFISPQVLRSGSTVESMQVHEVLYEALN